MPLFSEMTLPRGSLLQHRARLPVCIPWWALPASVYPGRAPTAAPVGLRPQRRCAQLHRRQKPWRMLLKQRTRGFPTSQPAILWVTAGSAELPASAQVSAPGQDQKGLPGGGENWQLGTWAQAWAPQTTGARLLLPPPPPTASLEAATQSIFNWKTHVFRLHKLSLFLFSQDNYRHIYP